MTKKNTAYSEADIQVLSEIEHVHKRSSVYLGNTRETNYQVPIFGEDFSIEEITFVPAVSKLFSEVVDNSNDELIQSKPRKPLIKINSDVANATFSVEDNGRGVPIGKHKTGVPTPQVVFTTLRSGRNFKDDKEAGVIGTNGMGVSLSAICSEEFKVVIHRDNKRYEQVFTDATRKIGKPKVTRKTTKNTGTLVEFKLKDDIFSSVILPERIIRNRAIEMAATNPGLTVDYNGTKYNYKRGFDQLLNQHFGDYYRFGNDELEFFVVFDTHNRPEEQIFSWVNSSMLYDGGSCNTQFTNAFFDKVMSHLEREAKRKKVTINRNDVRSGLLLLGNLKVSDPQYDSQAKTKMTGPSLRKDFDDIVEAGWKAFVRKYKDWLTSVVDQAIKRSNADATKKAVAGSKKKLGPIDGFMEANSKKRDTCRLLVTEGNSAKANIVQSRNPPTDAAYPLKGKINNVYGISVAELLKMGKVSDLISIIGLVPGKRAMRSELRYGQVCFATDADLDGDHITTLLVNLFFQFWPELFDPKYPPFFYRMIAPNVVVSKGKKRIHIPNLSEFEKQKKKYSGWDVEYMKGLGGMSKTDWDMILSGETDTFIPIINEGDFSESLELLFGPDPDLRKEWLRN